MLKETPTTDEIEKRRRKFGKYGYSKIQDPKVQEFLLLIAGIDIKQWNAWAEFSESVRERNAIVHDGKDTDQESARSTIQLTTRYVKYVEGCGPHRS